MWADPTIVNGVVYIGSLDGNLYALDLKSGAKKWQYNTGGAVRSAAAFADGQVFVGSESFKTFALSAQNGSVNWEEPGTDKVLAVSVFNGSLVVQYHNHKVVALDAKNHSKKWEFETDKN